jgi:membrane associated rhomboid family serine protease
LAAGAVGNLFDVLLMPATHRVIGASTAVFAALGLLGAYAWRRRSTRSARWPYRWAPLIAALARLALVGTGGAHTDVLAHLTGFFAGTLLGVIYGSFFRARSSSLLLPQLLAGGATLAVIVGAWVWALIQA